MSLELSFEERRVLGVLLEKSMTTPEQYPLSVNSVVVACNQKSCRDPVTSFTEDIVLDSLASLRQKELAVLVRVGGSRVDRWKHRMGETLELDAQQRAVLAELLLRGPQTDGELRQRAGRMRPFDSLQAVNDVLSGLQRLEPPLVRRLGPPDRRRGVKFCHLLGPESETPKFEDDSAAEPTYADRSGPRPPEGPPPESGDSISTAAAPVTAQAPPPPVTTTPVTTTPVTTTPVTTTPVTTTPVTTTPVTTTPVTTTPVTTTPVPTAPPAPAAPQPDVDTLQLEIAWLKDRLDEQQERIDRLEEKLTQFLT